MFQQLLVLALFLIALFGSTLTASAAAPSIPTRANPTPCTTVCGAPNHR